MISLLDNFANQCCPRRLSSQYGTIDPVGAGRNLGLGIAGQHPFPSPLRQIGAEVGVPHQASQVGAQHVGAPFGKDQAGLANDVRNLARIRTRPNCSFQFGRVRDGSTSASNWR
jgi:hypothetical protein